MIISKVTVDNNGSAQVMLPNGTMVDLMTTEKAIIPLSAAGEDIAVGDCQDITWDWDIEILSATITLGTAPVGSAAQVGIKKNGTDITTTKATVSSGNKVGSGAVLSSMYFDRGDTIRPYIHQVGSTTAGKDLYLVLTFKMI